MDENPYQAPDVNLRQNKTPRRWLLMQALGALVAIVSAVVYLWSDNSSLTRTPYLSLTWQSEIIIGWTFYIGLGLMLFAAWKVRRSMS